MAEPSENSDDSGTVIPSVALRWILLHATTSNVELANLSNVCRTWRQVVSKVILEEATLQVKPSTPLLLLPSMASQLLRVHQWSSSDHQTDTSSAHQTQVGWSPALEAAPSSDTTIDEDDNKKAAKNHTKKASNNNNNNETFCAAWFAPEGIQDLDLDAEQQVSENEGDNNKNSSSDEFDDDRHSLARMVPSNAHLHKHCRHNTQTQNHHHHNSSAYPGHTTNTTNNSNNPNSSKKNQSASSISKAQKAMVKMNIQRHAPRLEQAPKTQSWARGHGKQTKVVSFADQGIYVTHEWQGYRKVMDVLYPFGYAEFFVRALLQQVQSILVEASLMEQQPDEAKYHQYLDLELAWSRDSKDGDDAAAVAAAENLPQNRTQTTIAVRGATLARPEGYCLCWENPTKEQQEQHTSGNSSSNNSKEGSGDQQMVQTIKWEERQRKIRQWKQWRRQLQLTVLPQVVDREPNACPVVQFLNANEQHAVRFFTPRFACGPIGEPVTILVVGIATEDGCFCSGLKHRFELGHLYPDTALAEMSEMSPICMATDPWECQPSGNRNTGSNNNNSGGGGGDNNNDKSSNDKDKENSANATTNNGTAAAAAAAPSSGSRDPPQARKTPLEEQLSVDELNDSEEESEDDYSEDSSSDLAGSNSGTRRSNATKNGWLNRCTCIFNDNSDPCGFGGESGGDGNGDGGDDVDKNTKGGPGVSKEDSETLRVDDTDDGEDDDEDDEEDNEAERILRGSRIPGVWHCYSAVFDGKTYSTLRVDGVPEILSCEIHHQDNSKSSSNQSVEGETDMKKEDAGPKRSPRGRQRAGPRAMLDGLTIGSDHCFDMTLCFGQGSGGEGEGAIAEIAVFSGRLDTADLEVLEKQLMIKHSIPVPDLTREGLTQEDEWIRAAHALFCTMPSEASARPRRSDGTSFDQESIPLRVMAKHRSVAWHQWNTVTGEELKIKRIGSRSTGSSSDW